jgi:hypothetical protein
MVKQLGEVTVKKGLISVEHFEEDTEDITYAQLNDDDDYTTLRVKWLMPLKNKWKKLSYIVMWRKILF